VRKKLILLIVVLGSSLVADAALQKAPPTALSDPGYSDITMGPRRDGLDDSSFRVKQEAQRLKTVNVERQRTMAREATELLHMAGDLQLKAQKSESEVSREEMVRQVEAIERLAHNVKERMKGSR